MMQQQPKNGRAQAAAFPFCLSALALSLVHFSVAAEDQQLQTIKVQSTAIQKQPGVDKLGAEEIARPQARSLAEVLDVLPGVNAGGSPRPGGQVINVWGYRTVEQVQVQLDGANQVFSKYQQGTSFIEPELLGKVEVIKGAQSALYGNGGFGAVIRAETKSVDELLMPGESVGGFAKIGRQSNGGQISKSVAAYAGGSEHSADILGYISQSRSGDGKTGDDLTYLFSGGEQKAGMLKLAFRPWAGHQFRLGVVRQESDMRTPWAARSGQVEAPSSSDIKRYGEAEAWLRKTVMRDQKIDSLNGEWRYASPDNSWLDLSVNYAQSRRYQHDKRPESAWKVDYRSSYGHESWVTQNSRSLDIRNVAKLGDSNSLTTGLSWSKQDWDPRSFLATKAKDPDYNYGWINAYGGNRGEETMRSAYLIHEWKPLPDWKITPSLRYDQVALYGKPNLAPIYNVASAGHDYRPVSFTGWSPRLAIAWRFSPGWNASFSYVDTWRAPTVDEVYAAQTPLSNLSGTSRYLKQEKLRGFYYGLDFERSGVLSAGDKLSMSLLAYRQLVRDNIYMRLGNGNTGDSPGQTPPAGTGFYRNLSGYEIHGYDLTLDYQLRGWFASAALSATSGDHRNSLRDPWGNSEPVVDIPPRKAVLTTGYRVARLGLTFGGQGKFVRTQDRIPYFEGTRTAYSMPPSKGYVLINLFAAWQPQSGAFKHLEARVAVDNLFNRSYNPYLTEGIQGMGRSIRTSLSWRF
ncbi:TonB-dependent receptor domain-containing protein [Chromobacterium piscinae]|uniref:TonB-dependent receptor domain-containing protein n=1 Tax=Chromobacterium piscinae TaxID=686831 RepID=UPI001E5D9E53|nr:TonB-dependent receptor [Chromobacterium piscinae]MCD5327425.1 TonB-dependent receptor [Chromobacterium piscinae]